MAKINKFFISANYFDKFILIYFCFLFGGLVLITYICLITIKQNTMNELQLFMLMQNQVLEIRTGMMLTRVIPQVRTRFKLMVGLPKRANNHAVLVAVGAFYKLLGKYDKFADYVNKPSSLINGQPMVTEQQVDTMIAEKGLQLG